LAGIQQTLNLVSSLGLLLPFISLALIIGAVVISKDKIRYLIWTGVGLIIAMFVLLLLIQSGQNQFVSAVSNFTPEAGIALYETLTRYLRQLTVITFFLGALLAVSSAFWLKKGATN
jgi:FtsH-binding integral membrane protein